MISDMIRVVLHKRLPTRLLSYHSNDFWPSQTLLAQNGFFEPFAFKKTSQSARMLVFEHT
jgi:hypothetical protein